MTEFSRVGLIVKSGDDSVTQTLNEVITCLQGLDLEFVLDVSTENLLPDQHTVSTVEIGKTCDLAIVIGGDGTLLHAARALVGTQTALVGVNRGRLGFLVDVPPTDGLDKLVGILQGQSIAEERILLETRILRNGECVNTSAAFNDTVIRVHDVLQIMDFDIIIDDVLVTHQRADGVIIATPSGSTAYSLSNGGPIVGPTIEAVVLQPICPHTLTSRPLMVDSKSTIRIHLWDDAVYQAQVVCDGQVYMEATLGDMIEVKVSEDHIKLLHPADYDYHQVLREKLNWG
ncbi:MAG: NAD(+) kinase [Gammaproteobacteria bacterium]|nr:NAD(+) kinase [Gammaproteobacteria bacterium]